jgi:hypothetical protein
MVVNFSHDELELPKATILGVAEEISATLIAEMNPPSKTGKCPKYKKGTGVHTVEQNEKFQMYVNRVLGHLDQTERAVMEPVQVVNQTPERRTPDRSHRRRVDTPIPRSPSGEPPSNHCRDPNYVPPDTPTTRRELGRTRGSPPVTRYRARLHAFNEAADKAGPSD